ncbi:hypothetical protein F4806DRAFT_504366 [Annulohypoxylon nitens]|nr:hypothetical protein F4806DRAFT_504366 [Annulohypoxylon nitens]
MVKDLSNEYINRSDPLNRRPRPEPVTKPQLTDRLARVKAADDLNNQLADHVYALREDSLSDYEAKGFISLPLYFLSEYQVLIGLGRQAAEILANQDDLVFVEDAFNKILDGFDEYQRWMSTNIHLFKNQPTVHSGLLRIVGNLAREPWIGYYQGRQFRKHILHMSENIAQINPLKDAVWNEGGLIRRQEFGQVFDQFNQLSTRQLRNDADVRSVVFHSQRLLKEAFLGINLPNAIYTLLNIYSGEDQRPTYIDYRWDSDQYRFGEGTRPGILKLKSQLGGTLTAEETEGIKRARGKSAKRPPPDDDDPSDNADQQPPTKIPRLVLAGSYSMNLRNVDADLGNIYEEGSLSVVKADSYNRFDIVTRTLPNKRSTLDRYAETGEDSPDGWGIARILSRWRTWTCTPEKPPQNQPDRVKLIAQVKTNIEDVRNYIRDRVDIEKSSRAIREGRKRAYALKFLRSLHIRLLLLSQPPVSDEVMTEALVGRLEDWILFERIWNVGDRKNVRRAEQAGRGNSTRTNAYQRSIRRREQNITNWERLLRRIREGPPGRETNGDEDTPKDKSPNDKSPNDKSSTEKSLTSSPGETGETGDPANVGGNSGNDDENNIDDLFDDPEDSWGNVTYQNSLNLPKGKIYQMQPIHPSTGVHFNEREERDNLALRRASALDSLFTQRFSGPRSLELRESLARYQDFEHVLLDSFEEGGPPGHWGIPRETVFEQLAYMVVMTQWRTYMAQDVIKQGMSYPL